MDYALRQALKQFDARRTEKLGPSESAVFTPDEKGAAMIADVFLPIAKYVIYGGHFHVECVKGDDWFGYDIKFNKRVRFNISPVVGTICTIFAILGTFAVSGIYN